MSATISSKFSSVFSQLLQALEGAYVKLGLDIAAHAHGVPFDAGQLLKVEVGKQYLLPGARRRNAKKPRQAAFADTALLADEGNEAEFFLHLPDTGESPGQCKYFEDYVVAIAFFTVDCHNDRCMHTVGENRMIRALGLMSGTSLDGIDVAVIETDGAADVIPGPARSFAYSDDDRALLRAALTAAEDLPADPDARGARPGVLNEAEARVTKRHAEAVRDFLAAEMIDPASIGVIGFHGQTVIHRPDAHFTVQIGDGAALARETGRPVAFDFRAADVAAGGQGAPLVPIYHSALVKAAGFDEAVVVVNVGGVANLTYVDDGPPIAFDTGPGNAMIDDMMFSRAGEKMDIGGTTAAEGKIDFTALAELLAHPYFALPPPKSLDRNAFSSSRVASLPLPDAIADSDGADGA